MRSVLYAVSFLAVMGLAFWAYRENYATQDALRNVDRLQNEIADLRDELAMQKAEWAYLNRPDRIRELAAISFDKLGLLPMEPSQFGDAKDIPYPPPPAASLPSDLSLSAPISVQGQLDIVPTNEVQIP
ncbi:cell division protein FtsL [Tabrizicola sp. J26]|uniref:cell division protein FtsL n=1 Tax=Alitabrizicola rongguiensis TaxID=2909234 RepID=UPI001F3C0E7A|nr:cell division protein FtsL [Tabrizicola rongguiensis]MCF1708961.1 cell division protein FtsL [Tabrizicola rongguiensis]